jgi:transketolase
MALRKPWIGLKRMKIKEIEKIAKSLRKEIIEMSYKANKAHISSCLCVIDIITYLYWHELKIKPKNPEWQMRDKFLLSKGHAGPALYAALAYKGYFPKTELTQYGKNNSKLGVHPEFGSFPGIEISAGSLGHGLSIGVGMALANKINKLSNKIYVLISDAECNEGKIWEAITFAGHHKLNNLFLLIDLNGLQALGKTKDVIKIESLKDSISGFGWNTFEVNGNNITYLDKLFRMIKNKKTIKPTAIICKTIAGKGIPFMEGKLEWHYKNLDENLYKQALQELNK